MMHRHRTAILVAVLFSCSKHCYERNSPLRANSCVPLSDLLYATSGSTFVYKDQVLANSVGGKLLIIR